MASIYGTVDESRRTFSGLKSDRFLAQTSNRVIAVLLTTAITVALASCGQTASVRTANDEPNGEPKTRPLQSIPATAAAIEVVRGGLLAGYNSTTVGKAFEGTFRNPKWTSFATPKGATVVEFNGAIALGALHAALFYPPVSEEQYATCKQSGVEDRNHDDYRACVDALTYPVKFQFTMATDNRTFEIGYMSPEPFQHTTVTGPSSVGSDADIETTLNFIYK